MDAGQVGEKSWEQEDEQFAGNLLVGPDESSQGDGERLGKVSAGYEGGDGDHLGVMTPERVGSDADEEVEEILSGTGTEGFHVAESGDTVEDPSLVREAEVSDPDSNTLQDFSLVNAEGREAEGGDPDSSTLQDFSLVHVEGHEDTQVDLSVDELPQREDEGVRRYTEQMKGQLGLDHSNKCLVLLNVYLYTVSLVLAESAPLSVKVQNCQFTILKLCDAQLMLLQNLQSGANNILEKLKIAYLYLQDGFPDFAKTDIEVIAKDVESMKSRCEKCTKDFEELKISMNDLVTRLGQALKDEGFGSNSQFDYVLQSAEEFLRSLDSAMPKPRIRQEKDQIEEDIVTCLKLHLALRATQITRSPLEDILNVLAKTAQMVEDWYKESRDVIQPNFEANIKRAEGLDPDKQREYWNSLAFKKEVRFYYERWRALQVYCEKLRQELRGVRRQAEVNYTDNPRPHEAVKRAWERAEGEQEEGIQGIVGRKELWPRMLNEWTPPRTASPILPQSPPPQTFEPRWYHDILNIFFLITTSDNHYKESV